MGIIEVDDKKIKSMKGLHLYHAGFSNCSMRVRITAAEKDIPFESHTVNLIKQENLEDWYLKINPKGLVPAIVHDGTVVIESNDIMLYLEDRYPEPRLIPQNEQEAERVRYWVNLSSEIHLSTIKTYIYGSTGSRSKKDSDMERYRKIQPEKELVEFHERSMKGFPDGEVKKAVEGIHKIFTEIEDALKDHKWIVGDNYTMADIAWIPQYFLLKNFGFPLSKYKNVQQWAKECERRPSYKKGVTDWLPKVPFWLIRSMMKLINFFRR